MKYKVKVEHRASKGHVFSVDAEDMDDAIVLAEDRAASFDWDREYETDSSNNAWDVEEDNG